MKGIQDNKEYVVIGLGRFGRSVARKLEENGCMVLAVDIDPKKVEDIAEDVTHAVCLDITNEDAVKELGLESFDGVIISLGKNLEAALFAVIWAKEQGVKRVIVDAYTPIQGKMLKKIGADEIVYPENEIGSHLANNLVFQNLLDTIQLTADYSIADVPVLKEWTGQSLKDLHLRDRYHINVIAVRRNRELEINPEIERKFRKGDVLVVVGSNDMIKKLSDHL